MNEQTGFMGTPATPAPGSSDPNAIIDPNASVDNIQYPDGFDETLKGHASIKNFADDKGVINHSEVLKSFIHAQNLVGKDKIVLPDQNFTEDNWNEFFTKIGRPDISEYGIENKVPEGFDANEEMFKNFTEKAHSLGLLPKQAQGISDFYNELLGNTNKDAIAQNDSRVEAEIGTLKKEWGEGFDKNIKMAEAGLKQFADDKEIAELRELGFMDNIKVTKLFQKIGAGLAEDTFSGKAMGNYGMTPDEAHSKISTFYKPDHAYMLSEHPEHDHAVQEMLKLQGIAVGE